MARAWISYSVTTPESAEHGDHAEHGYAAPGGWRFPMPDGLYGDAARAFGDDNALTFREVLRWARDRGGWSIEYIPRFGLHGVTLYCDEADTDPRTGAETRFAVHFERLGPDTIWRIVAVLGARIDNPAR
jgi:hypothetical protein